MPNESAVYESMTDLRTHGTFRTHNIQSKSHPPMPKERTIEDTAPTTGVEIYEDTTGVEIYEDTGVELYEDMEPTHHPVYEMDDLTSDGNNNDAGKTQPNVSTEPMYEMDDGQVQQGGFVPTLPPRATQNTTTEMVDQPLYEMDDIQGDTTNTTEHEPCMYEMDDVMNNRQSVPSLPPRTSSNKIGKVIIPKPTVSYMDDQPLYELDDPGEIDDEDLECQHNMSYSMIIPGKQGIQSAVVDETEPLYD